MGWYERISNAFRDAPVLPLDCSSHFVLFSDCHRGVGNSNDNFLKNQHLYLAALQHYFQKGYTYLELGDGDELWENHSLARIIDIHNDVFCLLREFYRRERLYMLYGNHDHCKKNVRYCRRHCSAFHCQNLSAQMPRWHITPGSGQPQCRQLISGSWQASHPFFSPDPVQSRAAAGFPLSARPHPARYHFPKRNLSDSRAPGGFSEQYACAPLGLPGAVLLEAVRGDRRI